jgi:hypothetical protein
VRHEDTETVERFRAQLDDWGAHWGGPGMGRHPKPEPFLLIVLRPLYRAYPAAADEIRDLVDTLDDLLALTRVDLLTLEHVGPRSVEIVEAALADRGLALRTLDGG